LDVLNKFFSNMAAKNLRKDEDVKRLKAKFKLWLNIKDVQGVFGDGKWRLLGAINKKGSLKQASEALGMSYRKAWGDLKKAQGALRVTLVEKQRGGVLGGKTTLTSQGKKWVKAYTRFRSDIEKAVAKAYKKHIAGLVK
jgi:molybdate transport system regulatory protein